MEVSTTTSTTSTTLSSAAFVLLNEILSNSSSNETSGAGREWTNIERAMRYVPPVWWILGIPGNILAGVLWIQRQMRPSSGIFLAVLALDEFIFLVLQMMFELHDKWGIKILDFPYLCEAFPVVFLTTQQLSPLLVLGFTVQRYVAICHPFIKERFCTTRRSVATILLLFFFAVLLNAVQAYFWTFDSTMKECTLRQIVTLGGINSPWSIYSWITELLVYGVVPVSIFILNVMVVCETRRLTRAEEALTLKYHHTSSQHSQVAKKAFRQDATLNGGGPGPSGGGRPSATTLTLLVVSSYLIITVLPVTIFYVLYPAFSDVEINLTREERLENPAWQRYITFRNIRAIVEEIGKSHYALNFYIYLLTGRIFRKQLKLLLVRLICRGGRASQFFNRSTLSSTSHVRNPPNSSRRPDNCDPYNDKTTPLIATSCGEKNPNS